MRSATTLFDRNEWRARQSANRLRSGLILVGMGALLFLTGWLIFGPEAALWIGLGGLILLVLGSNLSPALILRFHRARPLTRYEAPQLHDLAQRLAERAGLEWTPRLYLIPGAAPNAFTIGLGQEAAVALSDGLLSVMNLREIAGVLAHEISHVGNGDIRVMALADAVRRLTHITSLLGQIMLLISLPLILSGTLDVSWIWVGLLIAAPTLSALLQLALSRNREFRADLDAARLTGDPEALASALGKLERRARGWERLLGYSREAAEMLRSHPRSEERIQRLLSLVKTVPEWRWEAPPRMAHKVVFTGFTVSPEL